MFSSLDEFAKLRIPLDDIVLATNNFANENLIKEDGIVKIYKGKLSLKKLQSNEWIDVDVRRLVGMDDLKRFDFLKKIHFLSSLKHENLLSIIGFCYVDDECIIVTEHAVYGSLDQHLRDPTLTWSQRLKICLGFVHGLWYLRRNHATHFDIGCSSVLLNKDWEAKVYCFGVYPENYLLLTFHNGRPIYELRKDGRNIFTSLGMTLLEVLRGRKTNLEDALRYIHNTLEETFDPSLGTQKHSQSLIIFLEIVYDCLKDDRRDVFMHRIKNKVEQALELQLEHEYIVRLSPMLAVILTENLVSQHVISAY